MSKPDSALERGGKTIKSIVITGSSTGIGRACALHFDKLGFQVFAGVRKEEDEVSLKKESSSRMTPIILDVTDASSISNAFKIVEQQSGGELHGLVNNAGISLGGPLELIPVEDIRKVFEVNVVGMMAVSRKFIPLLRNAGGRIINIGSAYGFFAVPGQSSYVASKHAAEGFTDSLRLELSPFGIPVSIVEPGAVETDIWDKVINTHEERFNTNNSDMLELYSPLLKAAEKAINERRSVQPIEVARKVEHALTSTKPKHRYIVGNDAKVASILKRFVPPRLLDYMILSMAKTGK